jgi:hypothetical protein
MRHFFQIVLIVGLLINSLAFGQELSTPSTTDAGNYITSTKTMPAIPNKISYQGMLTTSAGVPLSDGSFDLKFELFNALSGGSSLWNETQTGVSVQRGTFNVLLGSVNALAGIFNQPVWLEVTVVSGPGISSPLVLSPRNEFASAPYSLGPWLSNADTLYVSNKLVGIGTSSPKVLLDVETPTATQARFGFVEPLYLIANHPQIGFNINFNGGFRYASTGYPGGTIDLSQIISGGFAFNTAPSGTAGSIAPLSTKMVITNAGNVGIGTITPTALLEVNGDVKVNGNITYSTAKTGYISGSAFATGRSLYSNTTFTYSSGVYNNGSVTGYYMVPLNLPDGVTITEAIVYGYDGDASNEFLFNLGRHTFTSSTYNVISSASSGVAYSSGAINVTTTPSANNVVDNSTYSYLLGITMPASSTVRLYNYRIQFTYTSPGSVSQQKGMPINNVINDSPSVDGVSR